MADSVSHDQNFENLILDYPRTRWRSSPPRKRPPEDDVRIVPVRQEQLQERLGQRYRELDTPLLVEWADGPLRGGAVSCEGQAPRAPRLRALRP